MSMAAEAWGPEDGAERILYTALADVLTGIGFSLLLVAAYRIWGGQMTWRTGLYWGLAGFAAIVLSPDLGLPPEVPGHGSCAAAGSSDLVGGDGGADRWRSWPDLLRQALTGGRRWASRSIVLPHAYGAPQPAEHASVAPEALAHRFIVAATIAGLLFWAVLGVRDRLLLQPRSSRTRWLSLRRAEPKTKAGRSMKGRPAFRI